jgi:excisionase family DNA binding protein
MAVDTFQAPARALLNLAEAGAYMRCSKRHLERMIARGELPRIKLGSAVRVAVVDLDAAIARLRAEGE